MIISMVLTTHNRMGLLELVLASINAQTFKDFELIVLDDHSSDGTFRFCKEYILKSGFPMMYVRTDESGNNLGRLRNAGAGLSRGQYLIFLDDDIIIVPRFIEQYAEHFFKNPDNVYMGKLLYVRSDAKKKMSIDSVVNGNFECLEGNLFSDEDPRKAELKDVPCYYKVWGGNLGIKKSIFSSINGYDEDFIYWGGLDTDLGYRLMKQGYGLVVLDDCLGYHLGSDFKPPEELEKEKGIRLFEDVKKFEKDVVRNKNPENRRFFITVFY